ncbi:hypothetical protein AVEN_42457-1 [Araneus ventricosus]|uniref:Uncharacterized protein n=2 Tax=Araneus ventricosus TaxID=182803 RepID=A0A4Y2H916_ARAVE|nr:hypothetical protein AVEN_97631-1 [Araneus ventricosus]GBM61751.1 hypothetical protein AVEN_39310-1 [Araneus ventricosus]GBM61760.1 hypothetical protein AVEN_42457-1 [Araneus ventricosus]
MTNRVHYGEVTEYWGQETDSETDVEDNPVHEEYRLKLKHKCLYHPSILPLISLYQKTSGSDFPETFSHTTSNVGWVNSQLVGKYFWGIYPRPGDFEKKNYEW